jgi:hypothetical protein
LTPKVAKAIVEAIPAIETIETKKKRVRPSRAKKNVTVVETTEVPEKETKSLVRPTRAMKEGAQKKEELLHFAFGKMKAVVEESVLSQSDFVLKFGDITIVIRKDALPNSTVVSNIQKEMSLPLNPKDNPTEFHYLLKFKKWAAWQSDCKMKAMKCLHTFLGVNFGHAEGIVLGRSEVYIQSSLEWKDSKLCFELNKIMETEGNLTLPTDLIVNKVEGYESLSPKKFF